MLHARPCNYDNHHTCSCCSQDMLLPTTAPRKVGSMEATAGRPTQCPAQSASGNAFATRILCVNQRTGNT